MDPLCSQQLWLCPQPNANTSPSWLARSLESKGLCTCSLCGSCGSTGDVVCTAVGSLSTCSLAHSLCLHFSCCSLQQTRMEHHSSMSSAIFMARSFPVTHQLLGSLHLPEGCLPSEPSERDPPGSTDSSNHLNGCLMFRCVRTLTDTAGPRKKISVFSSFWKKSL